MEFSSGSENGALRQLGDGLAYDARQLADVALRLKHNGEEDGELHMGLQGIHNAQTCIEEAQSLERAEAFAAAALKRAEAQAAITKVRQTVTSFVSSCNPSHSVADETCQDIRRRLNNTGQTSGLNAYSFSNLLLATIDRARTAAQGSMEALPHSMTGVTTTQFDSPMHALQEARYSVNEGAGMAILMDTYLTEYTASL